MTTDTHPLRAGILRALSVAPRNMTDPAQQHERVTKPVETTR